MDAVKQGDRRVWGVRCSDGEVLWVDDEAAARRLLHSLVGAQHIVCRGDRAETYLLDEPPSG
jgi:hypothetical protein